MKRVGFILMYFLMIVLALICLIPFLIMVFNATQHHADLASKLTFFPGNAIAENYAAMMTVINIWRNLANSLIITVPGVLLTGYFGTLAAYGFEKFDFKGKEALFGLSMAMLIIPAQISLIGMYKIYAGLKMLNSYWTCILPSVANVLTVYWMRAFIYQAVHNSIIESATIDGCSEIKIFNAIILPLCKSGLMTISIMNFVGLWNDYINPLTFITSSKKFTLPVGVAYLKSQDFTNLGAVYLAVAISTAVILAIYLLFNSQIVGNVADGSVKG